MTVEAQRAAPPTDGIKSLCGNGENRFLYLQPPYMQYRLPEAQHAAPLHTWGLNCQSSIINYQLTNSFLQMKMRVVVCQETQHLQHLLLREIHCLQKSRNR